MMSEWGNHNAGKMSNIKLETDTHTEDFYPGDWSSHPALNQLTLIFSNANHTIFVPKLIRASPMLCG